MSEIDEIRAQHELTDRWVGTPYLLYPKTHEDRATLLAEVDRLTRERDEARAEVERLRAERDTLLLDAREFVRWFNTHYPDPTDHPWCVIKDRLKAHAATLAAIDAAMAKIDKEGGQ